jgi:addiction module HigA family antidote
VIRSFGNADTQTIYGGLRCPRFQNIRSVIERKLIMLDAAARLDDLRSPPGNRLEALSGDRKGEHSIRVNDQFRICFRWTDAGPENVAVVDYHQEDGTMTKKGMRPIHPGEILREEYLVELGMSANALAAALGVPANRVSSIVAGKRSVTAETALLLARALSTSPEFWLNLQQVYDLRIAERESAAAVRAVRPLRRETQRP